jgi:hypothetical protein
MSEVWCSVAWYCDEKDCPQEWHEGTYWTCDCGEEWCKGWTYDSHSDGDHDHTDEEPEDERPSWLEYSKWVIENQKDPLGAFMFSETKKTRESWECVFMGPTNPDYTGPANAVFMCARRGRGEFTGAENLPEWLKDYLGFKRDQPEGQDPLHPICGDFVGDWEGFVKAVVDEPSYDPSKTSLHVNGGALGHWKGTRCKQSEDGVFDNCVRFRVCGLGVTPRAPGAYGKELVRMARKHVREHEKGKVR